MTLYENNIISYEDLITSARIRRRLRSRCRKAGEEK
jgi:hypothetical protein